MNTAVETLNTDNDKLVRFVNAVNSEVNKEIDGIIGEAEASKKEIIEIAENESLNTVYKVIQDNIKKVSSKYVKAVAKADFDCKKEILIEREKLTQNVFNNVKDIIFEFKTKPQYLKYLINLVKSEKISEDTIIFLNHDDMKYSDDIKSALGNSVEIKEDEAIKLGGLSILYPQRGIMIDKTIDISLSEQRKFFNENNFFSQD